MRASLTQSNFSVVLTNSVGLKSGFFAAFAALTLSSNFFDTVERIVLLAGISIISSAVLLLLEVILGEPGVAWEGVDTEDELEDLDEVEDEDEEDDELESLSESECLSVWGGMLPVCVSVWLWSMSMSLSVCVSVCLCITL